MKASSTNKNDKKKIKDLKAQIKDLSKYKEDEAAFENGEEKYYEEVFFPIRHPIYSSIRHIMRALIQKMPKSYTNKWLNRLPTIVRLKITQRHIPT